MEIKLMPGKILVQYIEPKTKTLAGVLLPNAAKVRPTRGEVLKVGPPEVLKNGASIPITVKQGDKILFSMSGQEVSEENKKLRIIGLSDVLAVVKPEKN